MARKPRLHFPGACYHVILRGNAGNDIFFEDLDRNYFFQLLQEGVERYKHRIHAYCLMTNHLHLLVQVDEIPLSRIMQNVSFRYTRYINYHKKQTGHLFQGRYKALLIDVDTYLLELVRYIHNNPVRAGIVPSPDKYPWSSHTIYLGNVFAPWVTTDWVLSQFSRCKESAVELYQKFILKDKDKVHRTEFSRGNIEGRILGDDHFAEKSYTRACEKRAKKETLDQVIKAVCTYYKVDQDDLVSRSRQQRLTEPRAVAALIVRESEYLKLVDLGRKLKRDISGLSQAASRFEKRFLKNKELPERVNTIKSFIV